MAHPSFKMPQARHAVVVASARLAVSKVEAAQALGVSVDFLDAHVMAELRVARVGRRRLIPVSELERWLDEHADRTPGTAPSRLDIAGEQS